MKILYIHDNSTHIGGAETYLFSLMELIENVGHEAYFFSVDKNKEIKTNDAYVYKEPNRNKIMNHISYYYLDLGIYNALKSWIKKIKPDVIHIHNNYKHPMSILLAVERNGIPVIQTVHDIRIVCPSGLCTKPTGEICQGGLGLKCLRNGCLSFRSYAYNIIPGKLKKYLIKKINIIISPSRAFERKLRENEIDNVLYLPHFIDSSEYKFNLDNIERNNILFVGFLGKYKGVEYLIKAFPKILKEAPTAKLHIVGDGEERENLEGLVEDIGIKKQVTFHGRVPKNQMKEYYQKANVVVFPSVCFELLGLVGLEAMASGRPVVASSIGGVSEWLDDGKTGFLVKPGNSDQITDKVIQILSNEELIKSMGKDSRVKVEKEFRVDEHLDKLTRIYSNLIAKS